MVSLDGTTSFVTPNPCTVSGGPSGTISCPMPGLAEGTYQGVVSVGDNSVGWVNSTPPVSFTVDLPAPTVTVPLDIVANTDAGVATVAVSFTATATDTVDGTVPVVCTPPSGSTFPLGATVVVCSATDAAGNTGTSSFTVTVEDHEAPVLTPPADIVTNTDPGLNTAVVSFSATATDNAPGLGAVSCVPPSGSAFLWESRQSTVRQRMRPATPVPAASR